MYPFCEEYMKRNKIFASLLFAAALVFLASAVMIFINLLCLTPDITDTKLQVLQFESILDNEIYCTNGQVIVINETAMDAFDSDSFTKNVEPLDNIYVRITSQQLNGEENRWEALAILSGQSTYLSMDDVEKCYSESNAAAALVLSFGILITLALVVFGLVMLFKKK